MVDVRGDVLRPPHGTTPAAVKSNNKVEPILSNWPSGHTHVKEFTGTYVYVLYRKRWQGMCLIWPDLTCMPQFEFELPQKILWCLIDA